MNVDISYGLGNATQEHLLCLWPCIWLVAKWYSWEMWLWLWQIEPKLNSDEAQRNFISPGMVANCAGQKSDFPKKSRAIHMYSVTSTSSFFKGQPKASFSYFLSFPKPQLKPEKQMGSCVPASYKPARTQHSKQRRVQSCWCHMRQNEASAYLATEFRR